MNQLDLSKLYLLEKLKCKQDALYPIEAYMKTYNAFEKKMVPFTLFPKQRELLRSYENNHHNLVMKYRQAGISTVTQAYCASKLVFADSDSPETIVVIANKLKTAKKFTKGIADYIKQLPDRFFPKDDNGKNKVFIRESQELSEMFNGSQLVSLSTSPDALRGYTPTILILDEAAFIEGGQTFWSACLASLSTGGKAFLISTPNGQDEIYHKVYESTIAGANNDFTIVNMSWWQDPRYNKNVRFIKTDDIVDWLQLPQHEKEKHESVTLDHINWEDISDIEIAEVRDKISEGFIPISPWYDRMAAGMNYEKRKINQELEVSFIGSGDNVIDDKTIMEQERKNVRDPEYKQLKGLMWIWKEPEEDHRYILALDVSRGDSADKTGIVVIDFDTWEQVAEFYGHTPPDKAAQIAYDYGKIYNAFIVIDLTGMGVAAGRKLRELGYPNKMMYWDSLSQEEIFRGPADEKTPGLNFAKGNVRNLIVDALEHGLRTGFKARSQRLMNEAKKFIYKNGRADHSNGSHDDLLIPLGMALYVANEHFKKLEKAKKATQGLLNNWKKYTTETKSIVPNSNNFSNIYDQNPFDSTDIRIGADNTRPILNFSEKSNRTDPRNYNWLFGVTQKKFDAYHDKNKKK